MQKEMLEELENIEQGQRNLEKAEIRLKAFERLVRKNLECFTSADKKSILSALEIKITIIDIQIGIQGKITNNLLTIAQTWA